MRNSIFKKDKTYTFSDYFSFNLPCQEITVALGYSFSTEAIKFQLTNNLINEEVIQGNTAFKTGVLCGIAQD